jgi:multiple sugar transport system ATP-binding protein
VAQVILENVYKSFASRKGEATSQSTESINVLRRINLTVPDGEFMVLVGPSGCGKSTLLRILAGLEVMTGGNIWLGDRLLNDLPPKERDIAMVFQNYALYPHMSVYENIAFGLRRRGQDVNVIQNLVTGITRNLPKGLRVVTQQERAIDERVRYVAQLLQMEALLKRLPKQLSGGQRQRVALGRAIARNPQVFLMDEPLSNLDAKLRAETRAQIVKLQRQLGTTTIYVTHDQVEAMTMGDRIAIMNQGQIQQVAPPLELYNRPANRFVAEFIGSPPINFLSVKFQAPLLITNGDFRMTLPEMWGSSLQKFDGQNLTLGIRPEHLSVGLPATKNLPVQVELVENLGNDSYICVRLIESAKSTVTPKFLQVRVSSERVFRIGEQLWLSLNPDKLYFFDSETETAIFPKSHSVSLPFERE